MGKQRAIYGNSEKMRKPNIKAIKVMFALSFNVVLGFLRKLVDC